MGDAAAVAKAALRTFIGSVEGAAVHGEEWRGVVATALENQGVVSSSDLAGAKLDDFTWSANCLDGAHKHLVRAAIKLATAEKARVLHSARPCASVRPLAGRIWEREAARHRCRAGRASQVQERRGGRPRIFAGEGALTSAACGVC